MNYYILAAGTAFLIWFSWALSVRYRRYHGITRFFVFESIFLMMMLNLRVWFRDPFSPLQLVSWILLLFCLYPAVSGYILLKRKGNPTRNFENTSTLVKTGIYRYIRHPLYFSLFLLGMGAMLKDPSTIQLILGGVITVFVYFTARIEEGEMISKFGDEYRSYMKETRMFIPYVI